MTRLHPMRVIVTSSLIAIAACASTPSQREVEAHNQRAYDAAIARAQARFGGAPFEPTTWSFYSDHGRGDLDPAAAPTPLAARVTGQADSDALYRSPSGHLGFAGAACLMGGSCGCEVGIAYRYLVRDDGRVAVVRLTPDLKTYTIEVDSCGYGCGQQPPPMPTFVADLGVDDPGQLEVIEERYRLERVVQTCDNPIPAP